MSAVKCRWCSIGALFDGFGSIVLSSKLIKSTLGEVLCVMLVTSRVCKEYAYFIMGIGKHGRCFLIIHRCKEEGLPGLPYCVFLFRYSPLPCRFSIFSLLQVAFHYKFQITTILVKILGTSHKTALLQSLIQCPPLPPFQCWLNQTPFDHPNIELGGKGDEKVLNICFHLDILGNMTKTQKIASVPIYFDQDCSFID